MSSTRMGARSRSRSRVTSSALVLAIGASMLISGASGPMPTASAATPAVNIADSFVAGIPSPTAIAFTPDGRMLVTTQGGTVRVIDAGGNLLASPAINIGPSLCTNSERGMLGIAVDPLFTTNHRVYTYETRNQSGHCINGVSRYVLGDDNTLSGGVNIFSINVEASAGNHNGGDLNFGDDGYLYISVGDGGCDASGASGCAAANAATRRLDWLFGKILRVDTDGVPPASNPFYGQPGSRRCSNPGGLPAGTGWCQETFSWGLRNPFRFAFQPGTNSFLINDVGQDTWEEIDNGVAGADYGWNTREGHCATGSLSSCGGAPVGMTNPIYDYSHNSGCEAITGGAFVPIGTWPAPYSGSYLFSDYVCGKIQRLVPNGQGGYTVADVITGLGASSAVHLEFGPGPNGVSLYYTTYAGGGQIRRIDYTGPVNHPPVAAMTNSTPYGTTPLTVNYDASGSQDPDQGDTLSYHWDFGDGASASGVSASHVYATAGTYTTTLTVTDNHGAVSQPAKLRIDPGHFPPTVNITAPSASAKFAVGQTITLSLSASDENMNPLTGSAISWRVIRHHDTHTHPFLGPLVGNDLMFTAPSPEDFAAAASSYLEIQATVTDSRGMATIVSQNLDPNKVTLLVDSTPSGLRVNLSGFTLTTPVAVVSWEGLPVLASAPTQTDAQSRVATFTSWSDSGGQSHVVVTPGTTTSLTAQFALGDGPTGSGNWLVASDGGIFTFGDAPFLGSLGSTRLNAPIVGMAATPSGNGYWLVASDGGIFTFGDAPFLGSMGSTRLSRPVVGMAATPSGNGYWLVASDGGIFTFGDAGFHGSTGNLVLNRPVVGMARTATGLGYWLVASDGGVFTFGDAVFSGSTGNLPLARPVVGISATPHGDGYWLVASDGGVFTFGDAGFFGSAGNLRLARPVLGMYPTANGDGYTLVASDGGLFTFGSAGFFGSLGRQPLNAPVVGGRGH